MREASDRGRRPLVHRGVELRCGTRFEEEARQGGHALVAGVDEVGRGALCGPVLAGAVILGEGFDLHGGDRRNLMSGAPSRGISDIRIRFTFQKGGGHPRAGSFHRTFRGPEQASFETTASSHPAVRSSCGSKT